MSLKEDSKSHEVTVSAKTVISDSGALWEDSCLALESLNPKKLTEQLVKNEQSSL